MIESIKSEIIKNINIADLRSNLINTYGNLDGFIILDSCSENSLNNKQKNTYFLLQPIMQIIGLERKLLIKTKKEKTILKGDSINLLEEKLLNLLQKDDLSCDLPLATGYLSYELLHQIEKVNRVENNNINIPDFIFYLFSKIIKFDSSKENEIEIFNINYNLDNTPFWESNFTEKTLF